MMRAQGSTPSDMISTASEKGHQPALSRLVGSLDTTLAGCCSGQRTLGCPKGTLFIAVRSVEGQESRELSGGTALSKHPAACHRALGAGFHTQAVASPTGFEPVF